MRYYDITDMSFDISNHSPKKQTKVDSTQFELIQVYLRCLEKWASRNIKDIFKNMQIDLVFLCQILTFKIIEKGGR